MPYRRKFRFGVPTFDIFRGHYRDAEAVWVEGIEGLDRARERMNQIAAETPGPYFVFSCDDRLVLDIINTARDLKRSTFPASAKSDAA